MILLKLLWPLYRQYKNKLTLALALALLTLVAGVSLLGLSGWFLTSAALAGAGAAFNLFVPSSLVRALSFIRILARYAERVYGHDATMALLADLRGVVFKALIRLTPRQLVQYRDGELVARLTSDVSALDTVFLLIVAPVITAVLTGTILTFILGAWIPSVALPLSFIVLSLSFVLPLWLMYSGYAAGQLVQESVGNIRTSILEGVEGHADGVALNASPTILKRFEQACVCSAQARSQQANHAACGQAILQVLMGAGLIVILVLGLNSLQKGMLSGPTLVAGLLSFLALVEVGNAIVRGATRMGSALSAAHRLHEITQTKADIIDSPYPKPLAVKGAIDIKDVWFSYPSPNFSSGSSVLTGANLHVAAGERVAIMGPSGSGKSTFLHLLLRLEEPTKGCILFDGNNINCCAQAELHQRFALLSQHSPVFLGSFRTNLLIANAQATEVKLWQALDAARLGDFVRSLPQGLETWLGEGGSSLSLGQVRRLCLARTLLSEASVLLLDEPTAGLDRDTEIDFLIDLKSATNERTVVLVTHAELPTQAVDRIFVLSKGVLQDQEG